MSLGFKPSRLSYEDLRRIADDFLKEHHPTLTIPIPIEKIVEFTFGIEIIPVVNLQQTWDVDGFISGDMTQITVDQFVMMERENRYRFTLAHEIGHLVMHRDIISAHWPNRIKEYKELISSFPAEDYRWFEYQANAFAGLALVPGSELAKETNKWIAEVRAYTEFEDELLDPIWDRIAGKLAEAFCVSKNVINIRLGKDGFRD